MHRSLTVIASHSEALSRSVSSYARLARLPPPTLAAVEVNHVIRRRQIAEAHGGTFTL